MEWLGTVDDIPNLVWLRGLPGNSFRPARTTKGKNYVELHKHIITRDSDRTESWPSPPDSNSSGDERLPRISYAVPPAPWMQPTRNERLGVEFPDPRQMARTLVPLIYLEGISAPPRQPLDDFAIRAFDSHAV